MKTLHICFSEGWGGLEMASLQWARLLNDDSHQSFSITGPNSPLAKQLRKSRFHVEEVPYRFYVSPRTSLKIRKFVIDNKIDAVFLQSIKDLWLVSPALWGLDVKLVGFAQMWLQNISKKDLLHKLIYSRMDHLITLTPTQGEQYLSCIPYPKKKSVVMPNSIKGEKFSPDFREDLLRQEFGAMTGDILIGLVGRLDEQKGQLELIHAFAQARQQNPNLPLKLVLIGEATEGSGEVYTNRLKQAVEKHKLKDHVHFTGFRKEIPRIMASLDIFVLNSYQEAFGFVVVEALMSGAPVIATKSGGVPDILEGGKYGTLVPPKEIPPLATAIGQLALDPAHRQTISKKARAYALENFDEQKNKAKMIRLIKTGSPQ